MRIRRVRPGGEPAGYKIECLLQLPHFPRTARACRKLASSKSYPVCMSRCRSRQDARVFTNDAPITTISASLKRRLRQPLMFFLSCVLP